MRLVTDTSIDNMNGDLRVVALPVELRPDLGLRNKQTFGLDSPKQCFDRPDKIERAVANGEAVPHLS